MYYSNCLSGATFRDLFLLLLLGKAYKRGGWRGGERGLWFLRLRDALLLHISLFYVPLALQWTNNCCVKKKKHHKVTTLAFSGRNWEYQIPAKIKESNNRRLRSRQNCTDRLDPSEETVPKLSNCLTSKRVIPNYVMKPHVLGTPTLLMSCRLCRVLVKPGCA